MLSVLKYITAAVMPDFVTAGFTADSNDMTVESDENVTVILNLCMWLKIDRDTKVRVFLGEQVIISC